VLIFTVCHGNLAPLLVDLVCCLSFSAREVPIDVDLLTHHFICGFSWLFSGGDDLLCLVRRAQHDQKRLDFPGLHTTKSLGDNSIYMYIKLITTNVCEKGLIAD
jgi:hypothetical protein